MELFECDQDLEIIRDALRQFDPDGLGFINEQDMRILMQQVLRKIQFDTAYIIKPLILNIVVMVELQRISKRVIRSKVSKI